MSGGSVSRLLGACLAVLAFAAFSASAAAAGSVRAISETPTPVASGAAEVVGAHPAASTLTLNVDLTVRNQAGLRAVIAAAGNPASPDYGDYLTQAEYLTGYAPTDAEVAAATDWLGAQGVTITGVSKDNLLIHASAPTATIERAFHVKVRDYVARTGRSYFANDRDPVVPAYLRIHYVGGLSDYQYSEPATTCTPTDRCGFEGNELRKAYDYVGNGEGQTIGFTLWGKPIAQTNYTEYAKATGTTALTVGGSGNNGLTFIQVGKASTETEPEGEIALDTEMAHAVAPGVRRDLLARRKGQYQHRRRNARRSRQLLDQGDLRQLDREQRRKVPERQRRIRTVRNRLEPRNHPRTRSRDRQDLLLRQRRQRRLAPVCISRRE